VPRHVARLVTWLVVDYFDYAGRPGASARRAAHHATRRRLLRLGRASGCLGTSRGSSRGSSSTTSTTPRVQVPRHIARLVTRLVTPLVVDYFASVTRPGASTHHAARHAARRQLLRLRRVSGCYGTSRGSSLTTSTTPRVRVHRHVARFFAQARRRLLRLRRASGASARRAGRHIGSSSTTSTTPHVRLLRHVARLVVDYFDYDARPGASARCAARRAGSSSTTSTTSRVRVPLHVARLITRLVVLLALDYFAYASRMGASARRAARHAARRAARRRLLRLRRASGCLGRSHRSSRGSLCRSSRGSLRRSLSTIRVPRHVARLVTRLVAPLVVDYSASRRLVVDYLVYTARPGALARRTAQHVAHRRLLHLVQARRRLLRLRRASGCLSTSRGSSRSSSRRSSRSSSRCSSSTT
jgi:hypothetical protein